MGECATFPICKKSGFPCFRTGDRAFHLRQGIIALRDQIFLSLCDGVHVEAGDIVVADSDGVVIVPRAKAAEVLAAAQEMDYKEHSMYGYIERLKSIVEAVKKFGRL